MNKLIYPLLAIMIAVVITGDLWGQSKLSLNKPVTASSVENTSYPASYAVDASLTTKWSSSSSGYQQSLYVDLQGLYDISKISISWADGRYATVFDVQFSADASTWITIRTFPANTNGGTMIIDGLFGKARYVKFNGRGRAVTTAGYRIADFSIYGYDTTSTAQQTDIDILTERLLGRNAQRGVTTSTVATYLNNMSADGSWPDLTYINNGTWPTHATRLEQMALAYNKSGNTYYHSSAVRDKIQVGLGYLQRVHPSFTSNWFDTVVSVPEDYMVALLIMRNNINKDSLLLYSTYLLDATGNTAQRGMNRAWVSGITIYKGCIEDRFPIVKTGYASMASCLDVITTTGVGTENEGIRSDYSHHQHRGQLYTGGYGRSMLEYLAYYLRHSENLSFNTQFTALRKQTLTSAFLSGLQLLSYKDYVDFGSAGRNISRDGSLVLSPVMLDTMVLNDTGNATAYQNWKGHINGTGAFPSDYLGTKYFWKSAILTSHGANFYMSAKIISSRTTGTESLSGENIKGYNLPLGATNIMRTSNEYRNIFPIWQWSRIPGTTAELNEAATALDSYQIGTNNFGGGLSHTDDGIIAYVHDYNNVKATKSYIFMNDQMICLGAGIAASKSNPIITSVDQSFANGNITYNNGVSTQILTSDSLTDNTLQWVHHNNIGYFFPSGGLLTVLNKSQSGSWSSIGVGSSTTITANVFSTYVNHSNTPSNRHYYYIVTPDKTLAEMPNVYANLKYTVVRNEADIQAVRYDGSNKKYAVIFYTPGMIDMGDGMVITSSSQAIVFIKEYSTIYRISVADPIYTQSNITLKINKKLTGSGATYANDTTTINFNLSTGDLAGTTVTQFYTKSDTVLAVGTTAFSASLYNGSVDVKWSSSDDNINTYQVECSENAKDYNAIYTVSAVKGFFQYSFTHLHPANNNNYYRIKMINNDGSILFSPVRKLTVNDPLSVKIFPNPAKGLVNVNIKDLSSLCIICIYDMAGKCIKEIQCTSVLTSIPLRDAPAGYYYLQIINKEKGKILYNAPLTIVH